MTFQMKYILLYEIYLHLKGGFLFIALLGMSSLLKNTVDELRLTRTNTSALFFYYFLMYHSLNSYEPKGKACKRHK